MRFRSSQPGVVLIGDHETIDASQGLAEVASQHGFRVVATFGWPPGAVHAVGLADVEAVPQALAACGQHTDLWLPFPREDLASPLQLDLLAGMAGWRGSQLRLGRHLTRYSPGQDQPMHQLVAGMLEEAVGLASATASAAAAPTLVDEAVALLVPAPPQDRSQWLVQQVRSAARRIRRTTGH